VAKLEASGVITGYQAKVDLERWAADPVRDRTAPGQPWHQKAYDVLAKIPELTECHRVTGDPA
jgi:Lrp/AsnC family leucine-responsive transcriptional regulator